MVNFARRQLAWIFSYIFTAPVIGAHSLHVPTVTFTSEMFKHGIGTSLCSEGNEMSGARFKLELNCELYSGSLESLWWDRGDSQWPSSRTFSQVSHFQSVVASYNTFSGVSFILTLAALLCRPSVCRASIFQLFRSLLESNDSQNYKDCKILASDYRAARDWLRSSDGPLWGWVVSREDREILIEWIFAWRIEAWLQSRGYRGWDIRHEAYWCQMSILRDCMILKNVIFHPREQRACSVIRNLHHGCTYMMANRHSSLWTR